MMTINTLLWDVDGTLLDFDVYEKAAFRKACEIHQVPLSDRLYERYRQINQDLWRQHELGLVEREELIYLRFEKLFKEQEIGCCSRRFEDTYQFELGEGCHYIEHAVEILDDLKDRYRMYVVTNGVEETQRKKIHTAHIDEYMDNLFISGAIGFQKPRKEFFDACFSEIEGFCKDKCMIIGDSLTSDMKGGIQAGIHTCWFNPGFKKNESFYVDREIHSLLELKKFL